MEKIFSLIKKIFLFIGVCFIFLLSDNFLLAQEISVSSAGIINQAKNQDDFWQDIYKIKKTLTKVFKQNNSPLINEVDVFIKVCLDLNIDCYLLPAIAGLESTYGKYIYPNSYNPFGWGGGYIIFNSWEEGIKTVSFKLKENYINKGLSDIDSIGLVYSESPTWAVRIKSLINNFEKTEKNISILFDENLIKL